ncbi:MAG TPA: hypothetical protein VL995_05310 [Cellvibrio sp.]|nr:hypothetical protein [Cellvibrio sp.]
MHDIDRTFMEYTPETGAFESENFEFSAQEWSGESGEVFNETEIMELASELLEVSSEAELNHFLGGFIRKAASTVGKAINSPVGQQLGGMLKTAAKGVLKDALPVVGGAVGGHFFGDSGTKWGTRIGTSAGTLMGLETEGLSHEDESFEIAKQYVRFAADAVKNATTASGGNPASIVQAAANQAAQKYAPGLVKGAAPATRAGGSQSGRWVRKGRSIILYGV